MVDYSSQLATASPSNFWREMWSSFKVWMRAVRVHHALQSCDGLSREAILGAGERVNFRRYRLDGSTFVVETDTGGTRRVPASKIVRVEDKGDWGY